VSDGDFSSLQGHLLVAAPVLLDPNFRRSVVLLIDHEPEGAVGVVLNRPSDVSASESVPDLAAVVALDEALHLGGPVQPEAVIALAEYHDVASAAAGTVVGRVGVLTEELAGEDLTDVVARARLFLGYAGWGPGQLEGELAQEAWFVEPARTADVFWSDAESLWSRVLERKGGAYRLVARMPDDPSLN
jgi:putative transcriptional regulator